MNTAAIITVILVLKWIFIGVRDRTFYTNRVTLVMLLLDILIVVIAFLTRDM